VAVLSPTYAQAPERIWRIGFASLRRGAGGSPLQDARGSTLFAYGTQKEREEWDNREQLEAFTISVVLS
jgi:hypothetical protein